MALIAIKSNILRRALRLIFNFDNNNHNQYDLFYSLMLLNGPQDREGRSLQDRGEDRIWGLDWFFDQFGTESAANSARVKKALDHAFTEPKNKNLRTQNRRQLERAAGKNHLVIPHETSNVYLSHHMTYVAPNDNPGRRQLTPQEIQQFINNSLLNPDFKENGMDLHAYDDKGNIKTELDQSDIYNLTLAMEIARRQGLRINNEQTIHQHIQRAYVQNPQLENQIHANFVMDIGRLYVDIANNDTGMLGNAIRFFKQRELAVESYNNEIERNRIIADQSTVYRNLIFDEGFDLDADPPKICDYIVKDQDRFGKLIVAIRELGGTVDYDDGSIHGHTANLVREIKQGERLPDPALPDPVNESVIRKNIISAFYQAMHMEVSERYQNGKADRALKTVRLGIANTLGKRRWNIRHGGAEYGDCLMMSYDRKEQRELREQLELLGVERVLYNHSDYEVGFSISELDRLPGLREAIVGSNEHLRQILGNPEGPPDGDDPEANLKEDEHGQNIPDIEFLLNMTGL